MSRIEKAKKIVDLVITEGSVVDRPANKKAKIVLVKRDADGNTEETGMADKKDVKKARSVEEILQALPPEDQATMAAFIEQQMASAKEAAAEKPPEIEAAASDMQKRESEIEESVRKAYDAKIAKMQSEIDGMKNLAKREKAIAKAAAYNLPGAKAEEIADVLLKFDGDEKATAVIDGVLKSAAAAVEKSGILKQQGGSGASVVDSSLDNEAKLGALADEIQKRDKNLTWHQAYVKACEENKALVS